MATSNAATTYLENKLLSFIFKNNAGVLQLRVSYDVGLAPLYLTQL